MSDSEEKKPVSKAFTAYDVQRYRLEKLMENPEKPVLIPARQEKGKKQREAPEFVRNVMGSSAGAGSGEFHVYRHLRRKEFARQRMIEEEARREELDSEYQERLERNRREAEERVEKNRLKRLKKKQKMKGKSKKQKKTDDRKSEEDSESDEDSEGQKKETETGTGTREADDGQNKTETETGTREADDGQKKTETDSTCQQEPEPTKD